MIKYTELEIALLILFFAKEDHQLSLSELEKTLYQKCKKKKPKTARQSIAALVRSTSQKLLRIRAMIERTTPQGRGNEAVYKMKGQIDVVRQTMEQFL